MLASTGYVLAAGGIVAANEALFAPLATGKAPWTGLNWRIIPATAILALLIGGFEKLNAPFGKGLGMLVLLSVLVIPVGNGPTPIQNVAKVIGA
jgi:hypothetical protein